MTQPKTVPGLRFPGFEGAWNETSMGELLSFKNGYNAAKEQYGTGVKFINVLDIIRNDFITYGRIIGSVDIPAKDFEKNAVKYGDILFQRSSETREEVGQANVYLDRDKSAAFGGFVIRGRPLKNFDPVFFNSMLKTSKARKDITSRSGGSTRYNIGQESLEDILVNVAPTLPEQLKIANFLTAVDGRIAQLNQKKALLEDYKKGVMQQLFTQALRFKDDHGNQFPDWEEKTLGKAAAKIERGRFSPRPRNNPIYYGGDIPFVQTGDVFNSKGRIRFFSQTLNEKGLKVSKLFPMGTILVTIAANIGYAGILEIDMACPDSLVGITCGSRLNNQFLTYFLEAEQPKMHYLAVEGAQKNINIDFLMNYPISVPSLPEQVKIGMFISTLDLRIENVTHQITHTQTFKKGLLQQMFV